MHLSLLSLGAALLGAASVAAQDGGDGATCSLEKKCPEDTPCCSQYGECGVGAYCLGGCDPRMSYSLDSCVPAPVCEDRKMKMDSTKRITDIEEYLGDAEEADWMATGEPVVKNGNMLLTMPKGSSGTVLASTVYMWYGNVKAKVKSSRGAGVITGFILLSDVKDEIDYEWIGADLDRVETNYYFQGIPLYTESKNISMDDTFDDFHEYEIQWTPDEIKWLVDGEEERVKKKSDTWNETAQQWDYPQTPARVQLSIWPGGREGNPQGTIDWAGGEIDWDHEDIEGAGYYYATFSDVEIECWDADRGEPGTNDNRSYYYDDISATNDTVVDSDRRHILKSLDGTGEDMDAGEEPSKSGSSSSPSSTGSSGRIPGGSSGGGGGQNPGGGSNAGSDGDSDSGGSSGGGSNCDPRDWNQDCSSGASDDSESSDGEDSSSTRTWEERAMGASAFAALIAVAGLCWV